MDLFCHKSRKENTRMKTAAQDRKVLCGDSNSSKWEIAT